MRGKAYQGQRPSAWTRITPAYAGKSGYAGDMCLLRWDHPRVCGEKQEGPPVKPRNLGSPPRMRGKEGSQIKAKSVTGITPAYAGKSWIPTCRGRLPQDHPRVCGEKRGTMVKWAALWGSPPRMRGKVTAYHNDSELSRITPAYAGKRRMKRPITTNAWDHPRVCGEKRPPDQHPGLSLGSPPRMRGKGAAVKGTVLDLRITPAYAGKRSETRISASTVRDHPRVCGEKMKSTTCRTMETGSPPRMRGKGPDLPPDVAAHGITPAYAGKSLPRVALGACIWDHPRVCGEKRREQRHWTQWPGDHPRVCGEKTLAGSSARRRSGSPPRMRGKVCCLRVRRGRIRITPAYAGKSSHSEKTVVLLWDHPRVCGEKSRVDSVHPLSVGSPPRMRGKAKSN